jgi:hypothetical protein
VNRFAKSSVADIYGVKVVADGVNEPRIWDGTSDGSNWVLAETRVSTAPTHADKGAGNLTGTYNYKVTSYREASGTMPAYESAASSASTDKVVTSKEVTVTYVDCVTADGWSHVRLYRISAAQPTWYRIAEVAAGSTTYDDNDVDATIAANDTLNTNKYGSGLPYFRYVLAHNGRLVGAGAWGEESVVRVGQPGSKFEDFLTGNNLPLRGWATGLGSIFEDVYVFTAHSVDRLRGVEDPATMDRMELVDGVGNTSPILPFKNGLYFADPATGPWRLEPGGRLIHIGEALRDFWRDDVNKDMMPHLPVVEDAERSLVCYAVATGTRPYATDWCVFDTRTNQWTILPMLGALGGAGTVANQYGKKKTLYGQMTGDIHQFGTNADNSYSAYDGTLTGQPTAVAGAAFSDTGATFDTSIVGCPVIFVDSDKDVTYRGTVIIRSDANTLICYPHFTSGTTTGDNYYIGGIEAYWATKEDNHGVMSLKMGRWVHVDYEIQSSGTLLVDYKIDGGSWTSVGSVDMTSDGSAKLPFRVRYHYARIRVRQFLPGRPWQVTGIRVEGTQAERTR